jgi:hypothetical protein
MPANPWAWSIAVMWTDASFSAFSISSKCQ